MPKSNPTGIWKAATGSEFELKLVGDDVEVQIVAGSNPTYSEYLVDLKGTEEPNTYKGTGHFKAKLQNGRECEFDTEWHIVVVTDDRIIGVGTRIVPNPETCEIVEKGDLQLDLQRKQ
jgi:hypothetical protein